MATLTLVLAEKPSVAQSIAAVLGAGMRRNGYLEGNGYLVSWCFGHLAELAEAAAYDERFRKWSMADLPILPAAFQYTVQPGKQKQFDLLRELMGREDVAEIVNACDAGREGELIFRTACTLAGCGKQVKRLWISSMEDSAIREGFQNLKDGSEYDGLHQSALCRSKADWLVGINATRFFSLLYGRTLTIGRVMSPTLALLVQREAEIAAFTPEPFYYVRLDCGFSADTERMPDRKAAEKIAAQCEEAVVKQVEHTEKAEKPPALYDLTTLQRDANRLLNFTAQQALDYLQALYEKKLCSYPRTDSRYLTDGMADSVSALVSAAAAVCGVETASDENPLQVCDSKKVTDHHALIPTSAAGETDLAALPLGEREILKLLALGVLRAVSSPFRFAETVVKLDCGGHIFTAKGKTILEPGWKRYGKEKEDSDISLPALSEGQKLRAAAAVMRGTSTAPKHHTEDSLLRAMETAGIGETPKDAERQGLGTPATRAGILEKLISTGFVERKKAKKAVYLLPTAIGTALITVLPEQLQSPYLTSEWEQRLKKVEQGAIPPEAFMEEISAMLRDLVKSYTPVPGAEVLFPPEREVVGKCPRCGRPVTESQKGFFCESRTCGFALWKNSKFFQAKKKELTKPLAAELLRDGRAPLKGCWSERTGKTYDAVVVLEDDGEHTNYKLEFERRATV